MSKSSVAKLEIKPEMAPLWFDENGAIRVGDTRVTLDSLIAAFLQGETPDEIARNFDSLSLSEVYRSIGYYLSHQDEVDIYLRDRAVEQDRIRGEVEQVHSPVGIRARLLNRKAQIA